MFVVVVVLELLVSILFLFLLIHTWVTGLLEHPE